MAPQRTSNGSWFEWLTSNSSGGDRTVTLDGATITEPDGGKIPLENQDGELTLILSGDNSITTTESPAIAFNGSAIHFQGDGTSTWVYTVRPTSGSAEITGGATQEWVQLWADGPKWAKFNVGSTITSYAGVTAYTNPDVVGGYYSYRGRYDSVPDDEGTTDTANYVWGSNWQTPTKDQEQALLDNCTWEFVEGKEGHQFEEGCTLAGWKVSGKEAGYTDNSIFLPYAGIRDQNRNSPITVGSRGVYWSSTPGGYGAYYLNRGYNGNNILSHNQPHGCSVRAIYVGEITCLWTSANLH